MLVPGQQKQARRCSPEAPAPCAPPPLIAFVPALIRRFFKQDCQLLTTRTFKCNAKQKRASDLPAQSIFVKTLEHRHGDGTDNNVLLWLRPEPQLIQSPCSVCLPMPWSSHHASCPRIQLSVAPPSLYRNHGFRGKFAEHSTSWNAVPFV